jgi:hypothetical protein
MASTKPNFWITMILIVLVFSFALFQFFNGLSSSENIFLDESSEQYISEYSKIIQSNTFLDSTNTSKVTSDVSNPLLSEEGESRTIFQDIFAVFNRITNILNNFWNYIKLGFQIPSFLIQGLGLPLKEWQFVINAVLWATLISIIVMLVRLAK